jgi:uncharacterized BrkB/YihY/UPF0761 family membrane protein
MVIIVLPLIGQEADIVKQTLGNFGSEIQYIPSKEKDIVLETLQSSSATIVFTEEQQKELSSKIFEYEKFVRQHTMDVFKWDLITTIVFFVMVIIITFIGIIFAILNIKDSVNIKIKADGTGIKGVVIKGTIGLVVLLLSVVFCYLYMKAIYPIYTVPPL